LPGCSAFGKSAEEALERIQIAIDVWIDTAHREGREIPKPAASKPQNNLVIEDSRQRSVIRQNPPQAEKCPHCGMKLIWVPQHGQWFCNVHQQYFPPAGEAVQPSVQYSQPQTTSQQPMQYTNSQIAPQQSVQYSQPQTSTSSVSSQGPGSSSPLLEGENVVKAEAVFLAKGHNEPISSNAEKSGIPAGILLLTNQRLFFLHEHKEKEKEESFKKGMLKSAGKGAIEGIIPLGLGELGFALRDLNKEWIRKIKEVDFSKYMNSEYTFTIPINRVLSYERFGNMFKMKPKNAFLRLTIADEQGARISYCLYANVPGKPFTKIMNHGKWIEAFRQVTSAPQSPQQIPMQSTVISTQAPMIDQPASQPQQIVQPSQESPTPRHHFCQQCGISVPEGRRLCPNCAVDEM
jgi:predicted RNase H-like HicB family nuclease